MPDPLTPDDLEAILRGGGSATEKLQRAAAMALEKRAMDKDLLTEAELWALASPDVGSFRAKLQAAARLGAERERERWCAATEKGRASFANVCGILHDKMVHEAWAALNEAIRDIEAEAATAIRRGEGE